MSGVWARGSQIVADFDNYQTTVSGIAFDFIGTMEEINPGTRTFSVTASGANDGIKLKPLIVQDIFNYEQKFTYKVYDNETGSYITTWQKTLLIRLISQQ